MKRQDAAPPRSLSLAGLYAANSLWTFLIPRSANASLDYFDLTPKPLLDAPVISASKKVEPPAQALAAIQVVTSEDIERSGITNIPHTLCMIPSVIMACAHANSWAISIRGFNSILASKLLVWLDGRRIYNPLTLATGQNLPDDAHREFDNAGDINTAEMERSIFGQLAWLC